MSNGDKLRKAFERMAMFPDIFVLNKQNNKVGEYFENEFEINSLPIEFLEFMKISDGIEMDELIVFSISQNKRLTMTYADYSSNNKINEYCNGFDIKQGDSKFFFFGCDKEGARYAFNKQSADMSVYCLIPSQGREVIKYGCFSDLLLDMIEKHIENNI